MNRIKKKWHVCKTEYNSDLKRKDTLLHVTKDILSEISQSQKINALYFYLYEESRVIILIEVESRVVVVRAWEQGRGKW